MSRSATESEWRLPSDSERLGRQVAALRQALGECSEAVLALEREVDRLRAALEAARAGLHALHAREFTGVPEVARALKAMDALEAAPPQEVP
jgi:phage shock protein A